MLPGLQSFCFTCAMAIAAIFALQASWFVAFLAIDQRRIDQGRNAFAPCCIVHEKFAPSECSQKASQIS